MTPRFKAILLAGGRGTRLYPLTAILSKQLVPLYNKPMIYYPLTTIMVAGIDDILVITTPEDMPLFRTLLGDGSQWGIRLSYAVQEQPRGIAEALVIGAEFAADDPVMLMLGDNIIYGRLDFLRASMARNGAGATIFAHRVADPGRYGVVEFDAQLRAISLEEKPARPRSPWAVPGIYLYGAGAAARARTLRPSPRGELEITDLNRVYLEEGALQVQPMGRGIAWFDTGTPESLLSASNFVEAIESRQGLVVGSPEEVAYRMGFLSRDALRATLERLPASSYREYIERIADEVDQEHADPARPDS
jgi:glucose-1-phosphate thymidylyltransferase